MAASSLRTQPWPLWAKLIVIMLGVVVLLVALPWLFNGMGGMMTPRMMR